MPITSIKTRFAVGYFAFLVLNFHTITLSAQGGADCASAGTTSNLISLPFSASTQTTFQKGDEINSTNVSIPDNDYLNGNDYLYAFDATSDGNVSMTVTSTASQYNGFSMFVFRGCPTGGTCLTEYIGRSSQKHLTFRVRNGVRYFIVIDNAPGVTDNYVNYSITVSSISNVATNQDCKHPIPLSRSRFDQNSTFTGAGNFQNETNPGNSCITTSEQNGAWYSFSVQEAGSLHFYIEPKNRSEDYNYSLYDITNLPCDSIPISPSMEISCNFSDSVGITGLSSIGTSSSEGLNGSPFNSVLDVLSGHTYLLYINSPSTTQSGYRLSFDSSTAVLWDNAGPSVYDASFDSNCVMKTISVKFDKPVLCETIQPSDFVLLGFGGEIPITSTASTECSGAYWATRKVSLTIDSTISIPQSYRLWLKGIVLDERGNQSKQQLITIGNSDSIRLNTTFFTDSTEICAPSGYSSYSWYYHGQTISGSTTQCIYVHTPGFYSVSVQLGSCRKISGSVEVE